VIDRYDIAAIVGLALVTIGVYFIYEPLALIVPGLLLLAFSIIGARHGDTDQRDK
jgi:hypothetical protein